jgi:hypothetical protein
VDDQAFATRLLGLLVTNEFGPKEITVGSLNKQVRDAERIAALLANGLVYLLRPDAGLRVFWGEHCIIDRANAEKALRHKWEGDHLALVLGIRNEGRLCLLRYLLGAKRAGVRAEKVIRLLHKKGAFTADGRVIGDEIAKQISEAETANNFSDAFTPLTRTGFVLSKEGPRGGYWLSTKGIGAGALLATQRT